MPNVQGVFRAVTQTDIDLVYSIYMEDAITRYMSFEASSKDGFKAVFAELRLRDEFLLYQENDDVVGIVTISRGKWRKSHVATIGAVAVPFEYQGKGVATRMFESLFGHLWHKGISRLELFVESDNPTAISLYKKLGFDEEGLLRHYFKREADSSAIDEIVMAKIL